MEMEALELTIKEKESALNQVLRSCPGFDSMTVQNLLVKCHWDSFAVIEQLQKRRPGTHQIRKNGQKRPYATMQALQSAPTVPVTVTYSNGRIAKKLRRESVEDNDSDDGVEYSKQNVFDSDDSDNDYAGQEMNLQRKEVYEFFNNANIGELTSVKSCSQKKAESIIESRPYKSWEELVTKFQEKPLQTDLLNSAQEYLDKRDSLKKLIRRCQSIVLKLEKAVQEGAGINEQPSSLNAELNLSDYQLIGLNWLAVLHQNGTNGILADEMGLGKTIQIIAFLAWLKEANQQQQTHVIVVPSSTLGNWEFELSKWCPSLNVVKYYGSQEERRIMRIQWAREGFEGTDIILTTYHVIGSSNEDKKMFRVSNFHYVIFDEAHMLKNMMTQRYATLLRINASRRILLTGTPLQNNLLELMSLLCFVMPKLFHNKTEDIKTLFSKKAPKTDDTPEQSTSDFEQTQIERAKYIMKPFFLRRLKKDVLNFLPKKIEVVEKVKMLPQQGEQYEYLVNEYKNIDKSINDYLGRGSSIMMDMRKLANHPMLMRYYFTDAKLHDIAKVLARDSAYKNNNPKEIFEDIAPLSDMKVHQLRDKYFSISNMVKLPNELVLSSGKFKFLDGILPELRKGDHRVLIFSQFVIMLDIIEKYLNIRGYKFLRLDGSTAVNERQDLIDEYTRDKDIFVFLLSTKAGGLGINLTSADVAIIHDIDFNPYNDKQAEDRVHRIGQTKEVQIFKLISEGTIEEGMNMIAQEKLKLEKEVTSNEMDTAEEHRCMVRLMKMALGLNEQTAEAFLSPTKLGSTTANGKHQQNGSTGKTVSKPVPKKIEEDFDIVVD